MTDLAQDLDELVGPAVRLVKPDIPRAAPNPIFAQFERCKPWLEDALVGGHHTMADVIQEIIDQKAQFWPGRNCAMVTRVHQYQDAKAFQVWLAGGDVTEMLAMQPGLEAWARLMGCQEIIVDGRKGWERMLKPHGYELSSVTLRKALG